MERVALSAEVANEGAAAAVAAGELRRLELVRLELRRLDRSELGTLIGGGSSCEADVTSATPFATVMRARAAADSSHQGIWYAPSEEVEPSFLVHVLSQTGDLRVQVGELCSDSTAGHVHMHVPAAAAAGRRAESIACAVVAACVDAVARTERGDSEVHSRGDFTAGVHRRVDFTAGVHRRGDPLPKVTFAALDRSLLPALEVAMEAALPSGGWSRDWISGCGLWQRSASAALSDAACDGKPLDGAREAATAPPASIIRSGSDGKPNYRGRGSLIIEAATAPPASGYSLRWLCERDAPLVNERWTYKSERSLPLVRSMIAGGRACVGVEDGEGVLCGWILRYLDGALGMLYVEEGHRRRGLARALLARAMADLDGDAGDAGAAPSFAYIVDGNTASERCFESLGWRRVASADWVGFEPKAY